MASHKGIRCPPWLRVGLKHGEAYGEVLRVLRTCGLATVCESARCPNRWQCWGRGTATFMICGDVCTRWCRFCSVAHGEPAELDPEEPSRVAAAVKALGLRYVVITSVTRDDLSDGGMEHFCRTIRAIKELVPKIAIEVLVPDFLGNLDSIIKVVSSGVLVFGHNIETVKRLTPKVRFRADYGRSLSVLALASEHRPSGVYIKSGLMVGLGETREEIEETLWDLRQVGCDIVTIGQYLQPSERCLPVYEYVRPEVFAEYRVLAEKMGFRLVVSGPLVRSSYLAERVLECASADSGGTEHELEEQKEAT